MGSAEVDAGSVVNETAVVELSVTMIGTVVLSAEDEALVVVSLPLCLFLRSALNASNFAIPINLVASDGSSS